ncbi:MAG: hypothetical protein B1H12_02965 [Desulfobacteraceae bacterium 4484_190.2]|nr:MAG: hypothetical protein B1H12_02965 [Desulfobacteraceae bacterium 4484_190.2]
MLKVLFLTFLEKGRAFHWTVEANYDSDPFRRGIYEATSIPGHYKHCLENAPEIIELQAKLSKIHWAILNKSFADE